jgi:ribonuclease-3
MRARHGDDPVMGPGLHSLQVRIGHRFSRPSLLLSALTHRSFGADHNERLEFLGDAVLNLAISELLYERFGRSSEGDLTRVRAWLVREDSLHRVAQSLDLSPLLRMSEGETRAGGAQRPAMLADALEAVIGAVHLDAGFPAALALVRRLFERQLEQGDNGQWAKDPKTALQERLQARRLCVPSYRILAAHGQAHAQTFEIECAVPSLGLVEVAQGRSRRAGEQAAAQRMLDRLDIGSHGV